MSSWLIFENSLENICMLAFGYEVCTKSVEIERYKKTDNRWSRTFYVDMWKLKLSYMIHLFSSYHVLIGCDIRFIELSMLGPNWKIFHMNRLLYCYDLSPDWPENIWKIKYIKSIWDRIWKRENIVEKAGKYESWDKNIGFALPAQRQRRHYRPSSAREQHTADISNILNISKTEDLFDFNFPLIYQTNLFDFNFLKRKFTLQWKDATVLILCFFLLAKN